MGTFGQVWQGTAQSAHLNPDAHSQICLASTRVAIALISSTRSRGLLDVLASRRIHTSLPSERRF